MSMFLGDPGPCEIHINSYTLVKLPPKMHLNAVPESFVHPLFCDLDGTFVVAPSLRGIRGTVYFSYSFSNGSI